LTPSVFGCIEDMNARFGMAKSARPAGSHILVFCAKLDVEHWALTDVCSNHSGHVQA
jgi:hypothetical protein